MVNIWIDDIRPAPEGYIWCQTYSSAVNCILVHSLGDNKINIIDFDHDLGDEAFDGFGDRIERTGYDVAKFIVVNQISINGFHIHSMNPVGVKNIRELLIHYGYKEIF